MSKFEKDRNKYQIALERAKAIGLYQYYNPLNRVIEALTELKELDDEFEKSKGGLEQFGL